MNLYAVPNKPDLPHSLKQQNKMKLDKDLHEMNQTCLNHLILINLLMKP